MRFLEIHGSVERLNWSCEWRSGEGLNCRAGSDGSVFRSQCSSRGIFETPPLEGPFRGPEQIINHHRMRKFRRFRGANHLFGATPPITSHLLSRLRRDTLHLPASVAKTAESHQRPEIQKPAQDAHSYRFSPRAQILRTLVPLQDPDGNTYTGGELGHLNAQMRRRILF
jgi:hypothetical protein